MIVNLKPMLKLLPALLCLNTVALFAQNHEENFRTINTVQEAKDYAATFNEVQCGLMYAEKDVFFFDDIDTSNLQSEVGTTRSFFGRTTKLVKDSIISVVNVQVITLDLSEVSASTAEILINQMQKRLENGETYWDIKGKYEHTSARFTSSPEPTETVTKTYNVNADDLKKGNFFQWKTSGSSNKVGILIVDKDPHDVPGFYTISYLNLNNGNFR